MNEVFLSQGAIQQFFRRNGFRPNDLLGQHFLLDPQVLAAIVETADLKKTDAVVEIGPGLGVLTEELCERTQKVYSIEKDIRFRSALLPLQESNSHLSLIWKDALQMNIPEFVKGPFKVVANLPYFLTSLIFRQLLENENQPSSITVLVQQEVAERITAEPGDHSLLSLSIQLYGKPELVATVPPSAFWPKPAVSSAILHVSDIGRDLVKGVDETAFFRMVRIGFSSKRKQLKNNLASGYLVTPREAEAWIAGAKLSANVRAQELALSGWFDLFRRISIGFKQDLIL